MMCTILRKCLSVLTFALLITQTVNAKDAKYVFLFIGDGMGIPQRQAAEAYANKKLLMNQFPAQGITTTQSANQYITGSAASATAMACGQKTNIGMLGMDPQGRRVESVASKAKRNGMKVGIISSVSIDHATPAAFYANVPKRSQYYDIGVALAESGFDFFGGGGLKDPENSRKNSEHFNGNALELAQKNGYSLVNDKKTFLALKPGSGKIFAVNAWLQNSAALPYAMDTSEADIQLSEFTDKAIELLDNENGFFLMVEGGKIDWACHANDGVAAIKDTLAFDSAIAKAYTFYQEHPEETLIVVTGDHECGGLTLGFAGTKYNTDFDILSQQKVSFRKFSTEILPKTLKKTPDVAFADIKPVITKYFGLKFEAKHNDPLLLKNHERKQLASAFKRTMAQQAVKSDREKTYLLYGSYDPLTVTLTHILNQKAGLAWTTYSHTGVMVTTSAIGANANLFQGQYDNTDIALKLFQAMGMQIAVSFLQ
jgi:alkaline phosphatase